MHALYIDDSNKDKVVAIDGPSGSGKSTVAKLVAKKMNVTHIDTGAMFRAVAYYLNNKRFFLPEYKIDSVRGELEDKEKNLMCRIALEDISKFKLDYEYQNGNLLLSVNEEDISLKIREHNISDLASKVSKLSYVRTLLLNFQRELVKNVVAVMEGRDIGTVVFPNASCKIFLTASLEVRAQRRLNDLRSTGNNIITLEELYQDVKLRDEEDSKRAIAPLKKADDAFLLDSSQMSLDQVVNTIVDHATISLNKN
ncbi:MAG: (d)CMP kinase [Oligoflexia bacterium]|nr:(d)CMP kinase [Oligoflexia bacterium]